MSVTNPRRTQCGDRIASFCGTVTLQVRTMNLENKIDTLNEIADIVGGEMYERYSGRGMYGAQCYGIVCDDPVPCIEHAAENGIKGAVYDQMGLQYIVYWPNIPYQS
jgi:hypothetical protein